MWLPWESFQILIFCTVVVACSFPFLPYVIMHFWYVVELPVKNVRTVRQYLQVVNRGGGGGGGGRRRIEGGGDGWGGVGERECLCLEVRHHSFIASNHLSTQEAMYGKTEVRMN